MSDQRDLGTVPASLFVGPGEYRWWFYTRIDFSGGTKRWTDHPDGDTRDVGDGHGSQTWLADRLMVISALSQGMDDPLLVQSIQLGNIGDNLMSSYALDPAGIRGVPLEIYAGWFDPSNDTFKGALLMFRGYLDAGDFSDGGPAVITLRPFLRSYLKQTPWRRFTKLDFPLILAAGTKVSWGSTSGTAAGSAQVKSTAGGGTTYVPPPPPPPPTHADATVIPVTNPTPSIITGGR